MNAGIDTFIGLVHFLSTSTLKYSSRD